MKSTENIHLLTYGCKFQLRLVINFTVARRTVNKFLVIFLAGAKVIKVGTVIRVAIGIFARRWA